jgi:hypothetical protein
MSRRSPFSYRACVPQHACTGMIHLFACLSACVHVPINRVSVQRWTGCGKHIFSSQKDTCTSSDGFVFFYAICQVCILQSLGEVAGFYQARERAGKGVAESFPLSSRTSRCYRFSMGKTSARSGNFWRLDAAPPHCHAAALQPQRKKIWHTLQAIETRRGNKRVLYCAIKNRREPTHRRHASREPATTLFRGVLLNHSTFVSVRQGRHLVGRELPRRTSPTCC